MNTGCRDLKFVFKMKNLNGQNEMLFWNAIAMQ